MNAGIALGVLAFLQLILAWLTDKSLENTDLPVFKEELKGYKPMGIADFFAPQGTVDDKKSAAVLDLAQLANKARAAVTALFVALAGTVATAIVVVVAKPIPEFKTPRIAAAVVAAVVVFGLMFCLLVKMSNRRLRTLGEKEDVYGGRPTVAQRWKRYWLRVRDLNVLTPYLTAALVANTIAIVAALKMPD